MGGFIGKYFRLKGVAESIHYADGSIEKQAKTICKNENLSPGDIFLTTAGKLQFKNGILHAITVLKPGRSSNVKTIEKCLKNIANYCALNNIPSAAIPMLGYGTGKLESKEIKILFEKYLSNHATNFLVVELKIL